MKRFLQAYSSFTRTERRGILALSLLLLLLVGVRATQHLWVKPEDDTAKQQALIAAWDNKKQPAYRTGRQNPGESSVTKTVQTTTEDNKTENTEYLNQTNSTKLFPFDPNTIDSAGLRQLGLAEKTTSIFLNWRRKGKRFYRKEEFSKLYTLSEADYKRLEPYITIKNNLHAHYYNYEDYPPLPQTIDLNTADSVTLVRLNGIGPRLAHRILERRRTQGYYTNVDQLREVWHFPDSTFNMLKQRLVVN